jgi:hypothetical protein
MSFVEVAGFLRRTEDEVREKAKELNYLTAADDRFALRLSPFHNCIKLRMRVRFDRSGLVITTLARFQESLPSQQDRQQWLPYGGPGQRVCSTREPRLT